MENLRVTARLGAEILTGTLEQTLLLEQLVAARPELLDAVERAGPPVPERPHGGGDRHRDSHDHVR